MTRRRKYAFLLALSLCGCGPQVSEVWLQIEEDASLPCLGASHLRVQVNIPGHQPEKMVFDRFGVFFDDVTFRCRIAEELRFSDLPPGHGMGVQLQLTDSTTDALGVLSDCNSNAFDVSAGSPVQQLTVSLYRRSGVKTGTVRAFKPPDWGLVAGIKILQFRLIRDADGTIARSYYISFNPQNRPDPFPLVISNLPTPADLDLYMFYLEGLDARGSLLRTWSKPVYLQDRSPFFDVQL